MSNPKVRVNCFCAFACAAAALDARRAEVTVVKQSLPKKPPSFHLLVSAGDVPALLKASASFSEVGFHASYTKLYWAGTLEELYAALRKAVGEITITNC